MCQLCRVFVTTPNKPAATPRNPVFVGHTMTNVLLRIDQRQAAV